MSQVQKPAEGMMRYHPYPPDNDINMMHDYNQLVMIALREENRCSLDDAQYTYMLMSSTRNTPPKILTKEEYLKCCEVIVCHHSQRV